MATSNRLQTLFSTLERRYRSRWQLPDAASLARTVEGDARLRDVVLALTARLNARAITFGQWQASVQEAMRRGGLDPLALVAAGALGAGIAALTGRRAPQQALARLEARFTQRVTALTQALADGRIDIPTWRAAFAAELDAYHPAAAIAGANGSRDPAVFELGRQRAQQQQAYLNAWAEQLERDGLPGANALTNRARMYAGAAQGTFSEGHGLSLGITLPVHPGDGRCRVNCRCRWDIKRVTGGYACTWVVDPAAESCPDCLAWGARYNPLFIAKDAA